MQSFIVLGLIPGTHLQITFAIWLIGIITAGCWLVGWLMRRAHLIRTWILTVAFLRATRRLQV